MRRGNCVVAVKVADESRIEEVSDILEECGAVDVNERMQEWEATGYVPPVASRPLPQRQQTSSTPQGGEPLQAVEEELKIGKRTVQKGRVRVHTSMNERPVEEQVSLRDEKASIERKKVDRPASEADLQTAFKDATIEIRETSEEAVVSKTARVVEEVRIGKQSTERQQTVKGSVRSTKIDVDNLDDMPKGLRYSGAERRFSSAKYGGNERRVSH